MIDAEGFRPNVGIILANTQGQVLWAKRLGHDSWQFPQGGIDRGETALDAMYRELWEEVGLYPNHVRILAQTAGWLRYRLPNRYIRYGQRPLCIGQKQKWFLLQLISPSSYIDLAASKDAEFDYWRWVSYWYPVDKVVGFKQDVYQRALRELSPKLCLIESLEETKPAT